jgi:protein SCO1
VLEGIVRLTIRQRGRAAACAALLLIAAQTWGAPDPLKPREEDFLYDPVGSVQVMDAHGRVLPLSGLWQRRPLLLVMVFASCAEICPPFLNSLAQAVDEVGGAGERYDVVVLSFDPRDTSHDMARLARMHGLESSPGWTFGVTSPAEARRLARSIGVWTRWDPARRQIDHPALVAAIDRGRLVRLLVGGTVPPRRLREVVWELRHQFVPTYPLPSEKVLFRCFGYDAEKGRLSLDWGILVLLLPGAFMVLCTAWIFRSRPGG